MFLVGAVPALLVIATGTIPSRAGAVAAREGGRKTADRAASLARIGAYSPIAAGARI